MSISTETILVNCDGNCGRSELFHAPTEVVIDRLRGRKWFVLPTSRQTFCPACQEEGKHLKEERKSA